MQPLEFARLTWTKLGRPPERAVYVCAACEAPIEEHHKTGMLAAGEWRAEAPGRRWPGPRLPPERPLRPLGWFSWGDIARQFVAVHKDPERHRVFRNTVLAEPWQASGEAPAWEPLMRRRETYAIGTVPDGVLFLTAGVDVQRDRLVVEVVGWGRGKASWSIDYGMLPAIPTTWPPGPGPRSMSSSAGPSRPRPARRCRSGCSRLTPATPRRASTPGPAAIRSPA